MNTKLFAIKLPENEKKAMEYISNSTNNTLSKLFYKPLQNAIFRNLGVILLYKIDLRNTTEVTDLTNDISDIEDLSNHTLPIIEDFIGFMLSKTIRAQFWSIFNDIEINEKEFFLQNLDVSDIAETLGREYLVKHGDFEVMDLNLARNIFFNHMLLTYFNTTAVGSIQKLTNEWQAHQQQIRSFQNKLVYDYLNEFQKKEVEPIKVDEIVEVSEYIE
jgi:hypothetical protein